MTHAVDYVPCNIPTSRLLHESDIPIDVQDTHGHISLIWPAYKGFAASIDILLRSGADVHTADGLSRGR